MDSPRGPADEAASHTREALALTRRLGARPSEAHALCLAGQVASTGGAGDAESHYHALTLADELAMPPLVAHCRFGLGKLHRRSGRREQAQSDVGMATAMYRDMDMRVWLEQAIVEVAERR